MCGRELMIKRPKIITGLVSTFSVVIVWEIPSLLLDQNDPSRNA